MAALLSRTSSSALASPTASCNASSTSTSTRGLASAGPAAPRRHLPAAAPAAKGPTGRRGGLAAARAQAPKRESRSSVADTLQNMGQRYDFLSSGMGALAVTCYFVVARGQDPFHALAITAASTTVALVLNELAENKSNDA